MTKYFRGIFFIVFMFTLVGCVGLGNMKEVKFQHEIESDMAMVNIIRRSILLGDGLMAEAWDGDKFIGSLKAGRLLQYKTKPGIHTFMVHNPDGVGGWGVAKGELKPGKTYYLKLNITGLGPINLGAAESSDPRINEWNTMTTVSLDTESPKDIPEKLILNARKILARVEEGNANVTPITDINAL